MTKADVAVAGPCYCNSTCKKSFVRAKKKKTFCKTFLLAWCWLTHEHFGHINNLFSFAGQNHVVKGRNLSILNWGHGWMGNTRWKWAFSDCHKISLFSVYSIDKFVHKLLHFRSLTGYCTTMHNGPRATGYIWGRQAFDIFQYVRKSLLLPILTWRTGNYKD